mmetsp:Transcript_26564/g.52357  ORF Transcript_26564/g.52357 Transcript_26564/m.52357 type:complete len:152 (-) Transcript_26564:376-831(-)
MVRLTSLFLGFLGIAHAGIKVTWEDCGSSKAHAHVTNVSWVPADIQPGDNVTITSILNVDKVTTKLNSELKFIVGSDKFDGCKGATIEAPLNLAKIIFTPAGCPIQTGAFTSVRYVELAQKLPKAKTTSKLTITDQDNQEFACVSLSLDNS